MPEGVSLQAPKQQPSQTQEQLRQQYKTPL